MSVKQLISADDLWTMPEVPGRNFELVEGELREVPGAGAVHTLIVALVHELMRNFVRQHKLGLVFPDGLAHVLRRNPDSVRIPDVSFVTRQRIPQEGVPEGFWEGAPTLAVEIVSPEDRAAELYAKARGSGSWHAGSVDPLAATSHRHRPYLHRLHQGARSGRRVGWR